jgi:hypothetical protein
MILFKKQLFYLNVKGQGPTIGHYGTWHGTWHTALWSCTHISNIIDLSRKTKMLWPGQENTIQKTIIWPWGQMSRSNGDNYGIRHTALWSCTHIPNIIDLSGKTKKLWSVQASLRRSRSEEKIRLKQYISLRSKGRHNYYLVFSATANINIFATQGLW